MFPHHKLDWSISRLERRLTDTPDDTAARLEYARACLSMAAFHGGGEVWYNRALTQARRVLQADPSSPGASVVAGISLSGLDRLDPAARYLDEALKLEPERAEAHLGLGQWHARAGDRHQAIRHMEIACRQAPQAWEPHYLLGKLLVERALETGTSRRLLERSQYHMVQALQLGPSEFLLPELLHHLGVSCLRDGRYDDAYKLFTRLLEFERYRSRARYYLGLVSYHTGRYQNSIMYLRQHMEASGESARVLSRIGMAYLHQGEVAKAREACNRALALEPGDPQSRWPLGCALLEEGHGEEAVKVFKEILRDDPSHGPAFSELVRVRRDRRDDRWLHQALRAEVSVYDSLPGPTAGAPSARDATRERIRAILGALAELHDPGLVQAALRAMDLTTDEGLRFSLWESALDQLAAQRASDTARLLGQPGSGFSAQAGREALGVADLIPEPLLLQGLQISEEDLRRAAVERHGSAMPVSQHRVHVERERQEARAWQALLLLAIATRGTRSGRNLLVRWASDADPELADAARAALALMGSNEATEELRQRARNRGAEHLVDALLTQVSAPESLFRPQPVSDDSSARCSTCGRHVAEAGYMMQGAHAVICDHCLMDVARRRRELQVDDPQASCSLCTRTRLEVPAIYALHGTRVCRECVDTGLGMVEREEVDRFLAGL